METKLTSGRRLRLLLEQYLKIPPAEFARRTGIPIQTISAYMSDIRKIGNTNIIRIISTFSNVNPGWLRTGDEPAIIDPNERILTTKEQYELLLDDFQELKDEFRLFREEVRKDISGISIAIRESSEKEILFLKLLNKSS